LTVLDHFYCYLAKWVHSRTKCKINKLTTPVFDKQVQKATKATMIEHVRDAK